jgi:hypothetical protein
MQRLFSRGMVACLLTGVLLASVAGCRQGAVQGTQTNSHQTSSNSSPGPPSSAASTEPVAEPINPAGASPASSDRVVLPVGGVMSEVTLSDGELIKLSLLERLEKSTLEDRDTLIRRTKHAHVTIFDGVLRIGTWTLQRQDDQLTIMYRFLAEEKGAKYYVAEVVKEGDRWSVRELRSASFRRSH